MACWIWTVSQNVTCSKAIPSITPQLIPDLAIRILGLPGGTARTVNELFLGLDVPPRGLLISRLVLIPLNLLP